MDQPLITSLLNTISSNQEIYSYGDFFIIHPRSNNLYKINARKLIINNKCKACCEYSTEVGKSIFKINHINDCTIPASIQSLKNFLSNPPVDYIRLPLFSFLAEAHLDSFSCDKTYGLYNINDCRLQVLGKFIKLEDPNNNHHDDQPVSIYFSNNITPILYEFFEDKEKMKFVEIY